MNIGKALIVDDSKVVQFKLKRMLEARGLGVDTASSGHEALDLPEEPRAGRHLHGLHDARHGRVRGHGDHHDNSGNRGDPGDHVHRARHAPGPGAGAREPRQRLRDQAGRRPHAGCRARGVAGTCAEPGSDRCPGRGSGCRRPDGGCGACRDSRSTRGGRPTGNDRRVGSACRRRTGPRLRRPRAGHGRGHGAGRRAHRARSGRKARARSDGHPVGRVRAGGARCGAGGREAGHPRGSGFVARRDGAGP